MRVPSPDKPIPWKSSNESIIKALRILARDIISEDGAASLCLYEAADRMEELNNKLKELKDGNLPQST